MKPQILHCMHDHPTGRIDPVLGRAHGAKIGKLPFPLPVEPTGRVLRRHEDVRDDCLAGYCRECKRWTEYRVLWDQVRRQLGTAA